MATEPSTTVVKPATVSTLSADITWIQGHILAVLLAIVVISGSIIGGIFLFESLVEKHDARVAADQLKKENVDTATQSALLAQLAQEHAEDSTRDAQQTTLIQSLVAQMTAQRAATAKQVATDATLDPQASADRLGSQLNASPGEITVTNNSVTLDLPMTRKVTASIDELFQAQHDVTNLDAQLGAQQILTNDAKAQLADANKVIAADKIEEVATVRADDAACDAKVAAANQKSRKRTFWTAVGSFVVGVLSHGVF